MCSGPGRSSTCSSISSYTIIATTDSQHTKRRVPSARRSCKARRFRRMRPRLPGRRPARTRISSSPHRRSASRPLTTAVTLAMTKSATDGLTCSPRHGATAFKLKFKRQCTHGCQLGCVNDIDGTVRRSRERDNRRPRVYDVFTYARCVIHSLSTISVHDHCNDIYSK
ncbi:hypothetical protein EVAR_22912_1 [Eumeta japonica]|uniref:Uncharacterized protein n=1 Tax=Eumeta variegata TaxID=151549 RepID=A0A4C1UU59_EUMVA|nr:hypothetical protein EVAR_22912_1 [Eumeta japonica]